MDGLTGRNLGRARSVAESPEGKETENRVPVPLETACPLPKYKLADGPGCVKYLTVKSGRRSTLLVPLGNGNLKLGDVMM